MRERRHGKEQLERVISGGLQRARKRAAGELVRVPQRDAEMPDGINPVMQPGVGQIHALRAYDERVLLGQQRFPEEKNHDHDKQREISDGRVCKKRASDSGRPGPSGRIFFVNFSLGLQHGYFAARPTDAATSPRSLLSTPGGRLLSRAKSTLTESAASMEAGTSAVKTCVPAAVYSCDLSIMPFTLAESVTLFNC